MLSEELILALSEELILADLEIEVLEEVIAPGVVFDQ